MSVILMFFFAHVQPVPSTELGPAARDVCANGFSYASPEDATVEPSVSASSTSTAAVGSKRNIDGSASSAEADTAMETGVAEDTAVVSFGNDSKKVRHLPKGGNRTGKTDVEKTMLRSYLRQGVDRCISCTYR